MNPKLGAILTVCLLPAALVALVGIALYFIINAVLETLLLPYRVWQAESNRALDHSFAARPVNVNPDPPGRGLSREEYLKSALNDTPLHFPVGPSTPAHHAI